MQELSSGLVLSLCLLFVRASPTSKNTTSDIFLQSSLSITPATDLNIKLTEEILTVSLKIKNESEVARGLMDQAQKLMMPSESPMMSYVLTPALTLAGIVPWVVPGLSIAAGFVQLINQMAFTAGLTALVRSYIFDHRPDEHVVYVNHGYGEKGHSKQHLKMY